MRLRIGPLAGDALRMTAHIPIPVQQFTLKMERGELRAHSLPGPFENVDQAFLGPGSRVACGTISRKPPSSSC